MTRRSDIASLRHILGRFRGRRIAAGSSIHLAAFGKHRGWDDHIPDLGVDTPALALVKRILYMDGLGGNIDSGAWDAPAPDRVLPGFRHVFVWSQGEQWILGRMWSSSDGKGRTRYPMVVCVEGRGMPYGVAAAVALDRLAALELECAAATSEAEVVRCLDEARDDLRSRIGVAVTADGDGTGASLAEHDPVARDDIELIRVLYQIEREIPGSLRGRRRPEAAPSGRVKPTSGARGTLVRVPALESSGEALCTLAAWRSFFHRHLTYGLPFWVIHPIARDWADVIVGAAGAPQFYGVRALPAEVSLTTEVPYAIDETFAIHARGLIGAGGPCAHRISVG